MGGGGGRLKKQCEHHSVKASDECEDDSGIREEDARVWPGAAELSGMSSLQPEAPAHFLGRFPREAGCVYRSSGNILRPEEQHSRGWGTRAVELAGPGGHRPTEERGPKPGPGAWAPVVIQLGKR